MRLIVLPILVSNSWAQILLSQPTVNPGRQAGVIKPSCKEHYFPFQVSLLALQGYIPNTYSNFLGSFHDSDVQKN